MKRLVIAMSLALSLVASSAGAVLAAKDVFLLDTYGPEPNPDAAGIMVLKDGKDYKVTVDGTWSPWVKEAWDRLLRGEPDPLPMYPSPGSPNGPVGFDAAWIYAYTEYWPGDPGVPEEIYAVRFSVDGGSTWLNAPRPKKDRLNKKHTYTYRVAGGGHPLVVQLQDDYADDNYGRLRITVESAK